MSGKSRDFLWSQTSRSVGVSSALSWNLSAAAVNGSPRCCTSFHTYGRRSSKAPVQESGGSCWSSGLAPSSAQVEQDRLGDPTPSSLQPKSSGKTSDYTIRVYYSTQHEGTRIPWPWGEHLETPR